MRNFLRKNQNKQQSRCPRSWVLLLQVYLTLICYVRIGGRVKLATFKLYLNFQDRLIMLLSIFFFSLRLLYGFDKR